MREIGIDRPRFDVKVSTEVFTLFFIPNLARKKYIDFWHRVGGNDWKHLKSQTPRNANRRSIAFLLMMNPICSRKLSRKDA